MNTDLRINEEMEGASPPSGESLPGSGRPAWLASLMLKRRGTLLPRFALYWRKLVRLPRPWRRRLERKLAVTLSGAALLLAITQPPIQAATDNVITVVDGEVADVDNGRCSLVEAIINARTTRAGQLRDDCAAGNLSGADTVVLPNNGLFELTAVHNEQFGPTGLPVITSNVTIEGNGATITRSPAAPDFRIVTVDAKGKLTLRNTTISGGNLYEDVLGSGAGVQNYGTLVIESSRLTNHRAYDGGGAIGNTGEATITNSMIDDNFALNEGAGIGNTGTMTVDRSTIKWNRAFYYGGGIYNGSSGQMTISNSTIHANSMIFEEGGGIYNSGEMLITNSTVSGNSSYGSGGGIYNGSMGNDATPNLVIANSTITNNYSGFSGGGIANTYSATVRMDRSIVSGNSSYGGYYYGVTPDEVRNRGTIIADNRNVIGHDGDSYSDGFTPGATDIVPAQGLDGILEMTLADNGGPTMTHALVSGSPAIDSAPNSQCTAAPVNGVDQRGEPRNQDGNGSASSNECDSGAFELQGSQPQAAAFFASASGSGTVGGVAFAPADILKYDPATGWTMQFDGSDVGITKNVSGFEILDNGHILLSFAANQTIPGLGKVTPQDVVRFVPTATGDQTAGSFQWHFDGSAFKLTTTAEKIDALGHAPDGRLLLSTTGTAAVSLPNGNTLKAQDEDVLGFNLNQQSWSLFFDGTAIPGLKAQDVNALWVDTDNGDIYISLAGAFNLSGVTGNAKDIVKLSPNGGGGYTPSLYWDGSANGFPSGIDGLEMVP